MKIKEAVWIIALYKIIANSFRIIIGIYIFSFRCDLDTLAYAFSQSQHIIPRLLGALDGRIVQTSLRLTCILAFSIIILSILDLFFLLVMVSRRRWGAIGFFVLSILWVPVELLFVSKFLVAPKFISLVIDIIIIYLTLRLILHPHGYFKKE